MATGTIPDINGDPLEVELPNGNGRELAAASRPVALSTEDLAAVNAITTAIAALPGDASAANQDDQTALLTSIDAALGNPLAVTGTFWQATQPVSAASLPLPSGASTSAKQDTIIGHVDGIESLLAGTLTIAGTVGVSGSVAVTGTFWQATQPVSLAALPALVAGSAVVGKVGIDQNTDGTTNKVNIDASLKSGTATRSNVASVTTAGGVAILASNASRKGAVIFNSDANALLLDLSGGAAAATRCQVRLVQYTSYEIPAGFTGAITGIWEADGSGQADVVEFT